MLRNPILYFGCTLLFVTAVQPVIAADPPAQDFSTPEAVFAAHRQAVLAGDKGAEFRCLTPESQHGTLAPLVRKAVEGSWAIPEDGELRPLVVEVRALLAQHGLDRERLEQDANQGAKPVPPPEAPVLDPEMAPQPKLVPVIDPYVLGVRRDAREPELLFVKLHDWRQRFRVLTESDDLRQATAEEERRMMEIVRDMRLESVTIDGDRATGTFRIDDFSDTMPFERIDGQWRIKQ